MDTNLKSDFKVLDEAIKWAKKRGYEVPPLEYAVLVRGSRSGQVSNSMRLWAVGLIYSRPFLKAFFGEHLIARRDDYKEMMAIGVWAEQVAVYYQGKRYDVPNGKKVIEVAEYDGVAQWAEQAPGTVIEPQKTVIELKNMACKFPIETHPISRVRVDNITPEEPAWCLGQREMIKYENPFDYLKWFMAKNNSIYGKIKY